MPNRRKLIRLVSSLAFASASMLAAAGCSESATSDDPGCATAVVTGTTFSLPQAPGDRSFQAHATFDGEAIWLTHTSALAEDESMRISALRIQCDGSIASEEVRVEEQSGIQTEPRITRYGDLVMLAWQRDDQVSITNLSTHYKIFNRSEGPSGAVSHKLDTQYAGAAAGNTWMPELDASAAGFVIAGLRGVSDYNSFQPFAQRIDSEGELLGATIDGELSDSLSQDSVTASLKDDGSLIMGWTRESDTTPVYAVHVRVDAEADTLETPPVRLCADSCSMVSLGGDDDRGDFVTVVAADGTLAIKPSSQFDESAPMLYLGTAGATPLYPTIAVGPQGGAVAWLQPTTGYNAEIHIQGFGNSDSAMVSQGSEQTIPTENGAIGPYRLSLIHIENSVYMITWTEGPTADLQVKWRFVDLAA